MLTTEKGFHHNVGRMFWTSYELEAMPIFNVLITSVPKIDPAVCTHVQIVYMFRVCTT